MKRTFISLVLISIGLLLLFLGCGQQTTPVSTTPVSTAPAALGGVAYWDVLHPIVAGSGRNL